MRLKDRQGKLDEMELVMKEVVLAILKRKMSWRGGSTIRKWEKILRKGERSTSYPEG